MPFLRCWFETHARSINGQTYRTCQIEVYFGLVLKMGGGTGDRHPVCEREAATEAIGTNTPGNAGQPGQKCQHGRAVEHEGQVEGVAQEVTECCNNVLSQITPLRSGQHLQTYADAVMMVERDRLARALSLHLQRSCILRFPRA